MASSATPVSSAQASSSSTARAWKYDVFLNFKGLDTRRGIVFHLHKQLSNRGIKTFMDDRDLEVGDSISLTLLKAIEESRFAIVVLSPNYPSSPWCLDELAKICECMEENNRILPLFYNVRASDVRHGKGSFGEAFNKLESSGRYTSDKVQLWKEALNKVASFSGWHTDNIKTDEELVEIIVDFVCKKIQPCGIIEFGDKAGLVPCCQDSLTDNGRPPCYQDSFSYVGPPPPYYQDTFPDVGPPPPYNQDYQATFPDVGPPPPYYRDYQATFPDVGPPPPYYQDYQAIFPDVGPPPPYYEDSFLSCCQDSFWSSRVSHR